MSGNKKIGPTDLNVVLKFGGGMHTKASPDEIDQREAADGYNFDIDLQDRNLNIRAPFDLIGTVPNAQPIYGGGSLLKTDGTVTTLFQAAGVVYEWDGVSTFTNVGTCNASSKLRGNWRTHTWNLTDVLILTDLTLNDTVKQWDGTTFSTISFLDQGGGSFGTFYAKYLNIDNEIAIFANVKDSSATSPHMMIGSKQSDYTKISIVNTPSSAISVSDPFFLLSPDLKPINALSKSFGTTMISTEKGEIFNLTGTTAQNYAFNSFYPASCASGSESMTDIGNDIIYGRQGRIESVIDTNTFGNSQASDLTAGIADRIKSYSGWTIKFNSRTRRAYAIPTGVSECWVLDTPILQSQQLSPWMRWTTQHSMAFQPTFIESMLDPIDGLEYIFMGDSSGNVYRMEGTGTSGDGGTSTLDMQFLSKLFSSQLDSVGYDFEGWVKYTKVDSGTITLTFKYQGKEIFDKSITITLPAISSSSYYGGSFYYGGSSYYGTFTGSLARQTFIPPGDANDFQVLIEYSGNAAQSINEIGIRFRAAGQ